MLKVFFALMILATMAMADVSQGDEFTLKKEQICANGAGTLPVGAVVVLGEKDDFGKYTFHSKSDTTKKFWKIMPFSTKDNPIPLEAKWVSENLTEN